MKRSAKKIAAVAVALVLVLPIIENLRGINMVKAASPAPATTDSGAAVTSSTPGTSSSPGGTTSTDPSASPSDTTSPTPSASPSDTTSPAPSTSPGASASPNVPSVPATRPSTGSSAGKQSPVPIPTPERIPQESASPEATPQNTPEALWIHEHSFEYVTIQEASETQDEILMLQCSCGATNGTITVAGSSVGLFIKDTIRRIANAPQDGTVTVSTEIWTCFNKAVMDALSERPDVTLVINYRYHHVDYSVTIPAGYEVDTLVDENGYCGFRYLDQVLGGSETAAN